MADDGAQEATIEEWTEPVDVSALGNDGPTTVFVGGFSTLRSAKEGLSAVTYRDDAIVVLPGTYEGDVVVDSTFYDGVNIRGEGSVTFTGRLVVDYTSFNPDRVLQLPQLGEGEEVAAPAADGEEGGAAEEPVEEEGEEGAKKTEPARPLALTLGNMTFLGGLLAEGLSKGYIDDCVFGEPVVENSSVIHCCTAKALTTVRCTRCTFYGATKSIVYAFPKSRAEFSECKFLGASKPAPPVEAVRRKRGYVPPPPPPPTAPVSVLCETGVYLDDACVSIAKSSIANVGIGVLCRDECKDARIVETQISLTTATGVLLLEKAAPHFARSSVSLTGREALVVGHEAHPNIRNCVFVGDVRLKAESIHTGLTDNIIGLNHQLFVEGSHFRVKGFTVVPNDPTAVKPKKAPPPEEDA